MCLHSSLTIPMAPSCGAREHSQTVLPCSALFAALQLRSMHDIRQDDIDAPLDVETTRDWKSQGEALIPSCIKCPCDHSCRRMPGACVLAPTCRAAFLQTCLHTHASESRLPEPACPCCDLRAMQQACGCGTSCRSWWTWT